MTQYRTTEQIAPDHPCLRGHFPGNPVVPAVVILECVKSAVIRHTDTGCGIIRIRKARFTGVLLPEQTFSIELSANRNRVDFICRIEERVISTGSMETGDPS